MSVDEAEEYTENFCTLCSRVNSLFLLCAREFTPSPGVAYSTDVFYTPLWSKTFDVTLAQRVYSFHLTSVRELLLALTLAQRVNSFH